jgi:hypothetical protein
MDQLINGWLFGINRKLKSQMLAGAVDMCWAIWISRNDVVFDNSLAGDTRDLLQKEDRPP